MKNEITVEDIQEIESTYKARGGKCCGNCRHLPVPDLTCEKLGIVVGPLDICKYFEHIIDVGGNNNDQ